MTHKNWAYPALERIRKGFEELAQAAEKVGSKDDAAAALSELEDVLDCWDATICEECGEIRYRNHSLSDDVSGCCYGCADKLTREARQYDEARDEALRRRV